MSFDIDETYYAFAIGYHDGLAEGVENCPYPEGYDAARSFYRSGYEAGVTEYCRRVHPEEE